MYDDDDECDDDDNGVVDEDDDGGDDYDDDLRARSVLYLGSCGSGSGFATRHIMRGPRTRLVLLHHHH